MCFTILVSICYTYGSFVFSFTNKICCITAIIILLFIYTGIYTYMYIYVGRDTALNSDSVWGGMSGDRILVGGIFRTRPHWPWSLPNLLYNAYRVFPRGKPAGATLYIYIYIYMCVCVCIYSKIQLLLQQ